MSKLYATVRGDKVTGEIIEKGQGAQSRLDIKLTVGGKNHNHEIGIVRLITTKEGDYNLIIDRSSYGGKAGTVYNELITNEGNKKKGDDWCNQCMSPTCHQQ